MCTHTPLHLSQNEVDSTLIKHKRVLGKITLVTFRCLGKASLFKKKNALRECDQMSYCANAATEKRQGEREREREKRKKKPKSYALSII